jgi:diketogulonate reductase-like aldo/keto reductase
MGYGTGTAWYKEDRFGPFVPECVTMVKEAVKAGYRHLDGAEIYGTEEEFAVGIIECGVRREELFVTTKVSETIDNIPLAIQTSLKKLQLEYVDLCESTLLAFPINSDKSR